MLKMVITVVDRVGDLNVGLIDDIFDSMLEVSSNFMIEYREYDGDRLISSGSRHQDTI